MSSSIYSIKYSVLKQIKPTHEEEYNVRHFVDNLMRVAKTISGFDCVIVGSLGKMTWLSGDHDIDLFIMFPQSTSREDLEINGLAIGKRIIKEMKGKFRIKYAEHPYVNGTVKEFIVDIVPCYKITPGQKPISAVDRSPLHLEYVISKSPKHDDVRLLKQFCKGIGVYGSDAKHLGFSGYICEILIIKYGSFEAVLKEAAKWTAPHIVSMSTEMPRKFQDALVVIDPTDVERNAAANVSSNNFIKFVNEAKRFLIKPDEKYFFPKPKKILSSKEMASLKARGTQFIVLSVPKPDVIDDVLYPQTRKVLKRLETILKHNEFILLHSYEWISSDIKFIFEFEVWQLPKIKKMVGPLIFSKVHSREFLTKYKNVEFGPYIKDNTWLVERNRTYRTAKEFFNALTKKSFVELEKSGIQKMIARSIKKGKIDDPLVLAKKNKELSAFLREVYFEKIIHS